MDLGTTTDIRLGPLLKHVYGVVDTWRLKIFAREDSKASSEAIKSSPRLDERFRSKINHNLGSWMVVTQVEHPIEGKNIWTS